MALGCVTFLAVSNIIFALTGAFSLPLYFSFYGSEAAVRFSLLLCIHSVLLAAVPNILKSALPMAQLVLFVILLLLPFNLTPAVVVWCYEKLLLLLEPVFSVVEAVQVVLVVMYISQSFVNNIDEQPVLIKSSILGITGISYLLSVLIFYNVLDASNTTVTETWIGVLVVAISALVLLICLYKEQGIISDAAVLTLVMMFIVWAMKQERLLEESPLEAPSQWLQSITDDRSFLNVFLSMAKTSIEHLTCAQRILQTLLSPTCLLLALVRVGSILGFLAIVQTLNSKQDEVDFEETVYIEESRTPASVLRPLFIRLAILFVYTEVVIRTINSSFEYDAQSRHVELSSKTFVSQVTGVRLWRVIQLFVVPCTYVFQLFKEQD